MRRSPTQGRRARPPVRVRLSPGGLCLPAEDRRGRSEADGGCSARCRTPRFRLQVRLHERYDPYCPFDARPPELSFAESVPEQICWTFRVTFWRRVCVSTSRTSAPSPLASPELARRKSTPRGSNCGIKGGGGSGRATIGPSSRPAPNSPRQTRIEPSFSTLGSSSIWADHRSFSPSSVGLDLAAPSFPPPPPPPPPPNLLTAGSTVTDDVSYGEHGETGLSFSPTKYDKMYIWKSRPNLRCKLVERPDGIAGVPLDRCGLRPADEDSFHTFRKFQISFEQKRGTYVGRDPIRFRLGVLSPSDSLRPGEFLGDLDPDDESTTYCAGADSTHSARDGSKHVYRGRGHEDHRMSHPCGREPLASPVVVVLIHGDRRRRPRLVWVFGLGKELVLIDTIARTTSGG